MGTKLTNIETKDFLVSFKNNSETFILEEGKGCEVEEL